MLLTKQCIFNMKYNKKSCQTRGLLNLSNQLSKFFQKLKSAGQGTEFHGFHVLISPYFLDSRPGIVMILTSFTGILIGK